jgi:hypothetical protein
MGPVRSGIFSYLLIYLFIFCSFRKWAEAVVRSKHVLKPQEISNSLLGMKQLDLKPEVVGPGVYLTLTKQLQSQIAHFTGQGKKTDCLISFKTTDYFISFDFYRFD